MYVTNVKLLLTKHCKTFFFVIRCELKRTSVSPVGFIPKSTNIYKYVLRNYYPSKKLYVKNACLVGFFQLYSAEFEGL